MGFFSRAARHAPLGLLAVLYLLSLLTGMVDGGGQTIAPGKYSPDGGVNLYDCPEGFYSLGGTTAVTCQTCPAGTYSTSKTTAACTTVPAGSRGQPYYMSQLSSSAQAAMHRLFATYKLAGDASETYMSTVRVLRLRDETDVASQYAADFYANSMGDLFTAGGVPLSTWMSTFGTGTGGRFPPSSLWATAIPPTDFANQATVSKGNGTYTVSVSSHVLQTTPGSSNSILVMFDGDTDNAGTEIAVNVAGSTNVNVTSNTTYTTLLGATKTLRAEWIQMRLPLPISISGFVLSTMMKASVKLLGSTNGVNFQELYSTGATPVTMGPNNPNTFTTATSTKYDVYRLLLLGATLGTSTVAYPTIVVDEWSLTMATSSGNVHVTRWYSQDRNATVARQDSLLLQPLYDAVSKRVLFVNGTYLSVRTGLLPYSSQPYSYVVDYEMLGSGVGCLLSQSNATLKQRIDLRLSSGDNHCFNETTAINSFTYCTGASTYGRATLAVTSGGKAGLREAFLGYQRVAQYFEEQLAGPTTGQYSMMYSYSGAVAPAGGPMQLHQKQFRLGMLTGYLGRGSSDYADCTFSGAVGLFASARASLAPADLAILEAMGGKPSKTYTCHPGTYSLAGSTQCITAPAGTYVDSTSQNFCPAGTFNPFAGAAAASSNAACYTCPSGTFSLPSSSACTPCAVPTQYSIGAGSSACTTVDKGSQSIQPTQVATFDASSASQLFVVPPGVTQVKAMLWGGGGGGGYTPDQAHVAYGGGAGGFAYCLLTVTPGETLEVVVGGGGARGGDALQSAGGFGGGGTGYSATAVSYAGGGGGRSAIRRGTADLVTAAGGGGGGMDDGTGVGPSFGGGGGGYTGRTSMRSNGVAGTSYLGGGYTNLRQQIGGGGGGGYIGGMSGNRSALPGLAVTGGDGGTGYIGGCMLDPRGSGVLLGSALAGESGSLSNVSVAQAWKSDFFDCTSSSWLASLGKVGSVTGGVGFAATIGATTFDLSEPGAKLSGPMFSLPRGGFTLFTSNTTFMSSPGATPPLSTFALSSLGDFAISSLVYVPSAAIASSPTLTILKIGDSANALTLFIEKAVVKIYINGVLRSYAATLQTNAVVHYAVTRVGSTLRLAINGEIVYTATAPGAISGTGLRATETVVGTTTTVVAGVKMSVVLLSSAPSMFGDTFDVASLHMMYVPWNTFARPSQHALYQLAFYDGINAPSLMSPGGFNGITVPASASFARSSSQDFTVAMWVYNAAPDGLASKLCTTFELNSPLLGISMQVRAVGFTWYLAGTAYNYRSSSPGTKSQEYGWQHYAFTRQSGRLRFFLNGLDVTRSLLWVPTFLNYAIVQGGGLRVGSSFSNDDYLHGRIQQLEYLSYARYTASFTPDPYISQTVAMSCINQRFDLVNLGRGGAPGKAGYPGAAGGSGYVVIGMMSYPFSVGPSGQSLCPPGTQGRQSGGGCDPCPPGTFAATAGALSCDPASAGYYVAVGGSSAKTACPFGTVSITTGATGCAPCGPGLFTFSIGSTACATTPAGSYLAVNATAPAKCPLGTFQSATASISCLGCPFGTYTTTPGAVLPSDCVRTPAGYQSATFSTLGALSPAAQTGLQLILSTALVNPTYTGPILQLRRANDSALLNFYADAAGNLGTGYNGGGVLLAQWAGTGAVYVTTWFDQSGRANHAYQTVTSLQPSFTSGMLNFSSSYLVLSDGVLPSAFASYSISAKVGRIYSSLSDGTDRYLFSSRSVGLAMGPGLEMDGGSSATLKYVWYNDLPAVFPISSVTPMLVVPYYKFSRVSSLTLPVQTSLTSTDMAIAQGGDFTLEFWAKIITPLSTNTRITVFSMGNQLDANTIHVSLPAWADTGRWGRDDHSTSSPGPLICIDTSCWYDQLYEAFDTGSYLYPSWLEWNHFTLLRSNGLLYVFLNGHRISSVGNAASQANAAIKQGKVVFNPTNNYNTPQAASTAGEFLLSDCILSAGAKYDDGQIYFLLATVQRGYSKAYRSVQRLYTGMPYKRLPENSTVTEVFDGLSRRGYVNSELADAVAVAGAVLPAFNGKSNIIGRSWTLSNRTSFNGQVKSLFVLAGNASEADRAVLETVSLPSLLSKPATAAVTFVCTGATKYFIVPAGVTYLDVRMAGARGGGATANSFFGAWVSGRIPVTPKQKIFINVGCQGAAPGTTGLGGFNGGGKAGGALSDGYFPGGGGGASDIRSIKASLASRLMAAGGSGGFIGRTIKGVFLPSGGGSAGQVSNSSDPGCAGFPATSANVSRGGNGARCETGSGVEYWNCDYTAANGYNQNCMGVYGANGVFGRGGSGYDLGGGGGGGWYGGGGGYHSSGAGGSSNCSSCSSFTTGSDNTAMDGYVTITLQLTDRSQLPLSSGATVITDIATLYDAPVSGIMACAAGLYSATGGACMPCSTGRFSTGAAGACSLIPAGYIGVSKLPPKNATFNPGNPSQWHAWTINDANTLTLPGTYKISASSLGFLSPGVLSAFDGNTSTGFSTELLSSTGFANFSYVGCTMQTAQNLARYEVETFRWSLFATATPPNVDMSSNYYDDARGPLGYKSGSSGIEQCADYCARSNASFIALQSHQVGTSLTPPGGNFGKSEFRCVCLSTALPADGFSTLSSCPPCPDNKAYACGTRDLLSNRGGALDLFAVYAITGTQSNATLTVDGQTVPGEWLQVEVPQAVQLMGYMFSSSAAKSNVTLLGYSPSSSAPVSPRLALSSYRTVSAVTGRQSSWTRTAYRAIYQGAGDTVDNNYQNMRSTNGIYNLTQGYEENAADGFRPINMTASQDFTFEAQVWPLMSSENWEQGTDSPMYDNWDEWYVFGDAQVVELFQLRSPINATDRFQISLSPDAITVYLGANVYTAYIDRAALRRRFTLLDIVSDRSTHLAVTRCQGMLNIFFGGVSMGVFNAASDKVATGWARYGYTKRLPVRYKFPTSIIIADAALYNYARYCSPATDAVVKAAVDPTGSLYSYLPGNAQSTLRVPVTTRASDDFAVEMLLTLAPIKNVTYNRLFGVLYGPLSAGTMTTSQLPLDVSYSSRTDTTGLRSTFLLNVAMGGTLYSAAVRPALLATSPQTLLLSRCGGTLQAFLNGGLVFSYGYSVQPIVNASYVQSPYTFYVDYGATGTGTGDLISGVTFAQSGRYCVDAGQFLPPYFGSSNQVAGGRVGSWVVLDTQVKAMATQKFSLQTAPALYKLFRLVFDFNQTINEVALYATLETAASELNTDILPCPVGQTSPGGGAPCTPCADGFYTTTSAGCANMHDGYFSNFAVPTGIMRNSSNSQQWLQLNPNITVTCTEGGYLLAKVDGAGRNWRYSSSAWTNPSVTYFYYNNYNGTPHSAQDYRDPFYAMLPLAGVQVGFAKYDNGTTFDSNKAYLPLPAMGWLNFKQVSAGQSLLEMMRANTYMPSWEIGRLQFQRATGGGGLSIDPANINSRWGSTGNYAMGGIDLAGINVNSNGNACRLGMAAYSDAWGQSITPSWYNQGVGCEAGLFGSNQYYGGQSFGFPSSGTKAGPASGQPIGLASFSAGYPSSWDINSIARDPSYYNSHNYPQQYGNYLRAYIAGLPSDIFAGQYGSVGFRGAHKVCAACPPGTFTRSNTKPDAPGTRSVRCSKVPAGFYSASSGATTYLKCAPGTYSYAGSSACAVIPAGTFCQRGAPDTLQSVGVMQQSGRIACVGYTPCTPGYYQPQTGATQCLICPAGTYSPIVGSVLCTPCPAYWYSETPGSSVCRPTPRGTQASVEDVLVDKTSWTAALNGKATALLATKRVNANYTGPIIKLGLLKLDASTPYFRSNSLTQWMNQCGWGLEADPTNAICPGQLGINELYSKYSPETSYFDDGAGALWTMPSGKGDRLNGTVLDSYYDCPSGGPYTCKSLRLRYKYAYYVAKWYDQSGHGNHLIRHPNEYPCRFDIVNWRVMCGYRRTNERANKLTSNMLGPQLFAPGNLKYSYAIKLSKWIPKDYYFFYQGTESTSSPNAVFLANYNGDIGNYNDLQIRHTQNLYQRYSAGHRTKTSGMQYMTTAWSPDNTWISDRECTTRNTDSSEMVFRGMSSADDLVLVTYDNSSSLLSMFIRDMTVTAANTTQARVDGPVQQNSAYKQYNNYPFKLGYKVWRGYNDGGYNYADDVVDDVFSLHMLATFSDTLSLAERTAVNKIFSTVHRNVSSGASSYWKCPPGWTAPTEGMACRRLQPGYFGSWHESSCPYGFYCPGSVASPLQCPPGTYSQNNGMSACSPIPAGQRLAVKDDGAYNPLSWFECQTGGCGNLRTYQDNNVWDDWIQFYNNASGTVTPGLGTSYRYGIVACLPGYFTPGGMDVCQPCPLGTYAANSGTGPACTVAAPGYFVPQVAYSAPVICPPGSSQGSSGQSTCIACAEGFYQDQRGGTACKLCGNGGTTGVTTLGNSGLNSVTGLSDNFLNQAILPRTGSDTDRFVVTAATDCYYPSSQPTGQPTGQPSRHPSGQPSRQPSSQPSGQPSSNPTSSKPTGQPSRQPSSRPSRQPTGQPSRQPTRVPTRQPTTAPTRRPVRSLQRPPTVVPTPGPTGQPTGRPTGQPSGQPSRKPTGQPSGTPTVAPTLQPSMDPNYLTESVESSTASFTVVNLYAFAVLNKNGGVVTWGDPKLGGDSSSVAANIQSGVQSIVAGQHSFAALKADGSVFSWGAYSQPSASSAAKLRSGIVSLVANEYAFAALRNDSSVVTFGHPRFGGDISSISACNSWDVAALPLLRSGVTSIVATAGAFAALKADGTVVAWGDKEAGGGVTSSSNPSLMRIKKIFSNRAAFAALAPAGKVVTWGSKLYGASGPATVANTGVAHVYSNARSFAALTTSRTITAWGDSAVGGFYNPDASRPSMSPTPSPTSTRKPSPARPTFPPSVARTFKPTATPSLGPEHALDPTRRPTGAAVPSPAPTSVVLVFPGAGFVLDYSKTPLVPGSRLGNQAVLKSAPDPALAGAVAMDVSNINPTELVSALYDGNPNTAVTMASDYLYLPQTLGVRGLKPPSTTVQGEWVQTTFRSPVMVQSVTVYVPTGSLNLPSNVYLLGSSSIKTDTRDSTVGWTLLLETYRPSTCVVSPGSPPVVKCTLTLPATGAAQAFRSFRLVYHTRRLESLLSGFKRSAVQADNVAVTVVAGVEFALGVPGVTARPTPAWRFKSNPPTIFPTIAPTPLPQPTVGTVLPTTAPSPRPTMFANALPPFTRSRRPTPAPVAGTVTSVAFADCRNTRSAIASSVQYGVSRFESVAFDRDAYAETARFVAGRVGNAPQSGRVFVSFAIDDALLTSVQNGAALVFTFRVESFGTGSPDALVPWSAALDLYFAGISSTVQDARYLWDKVQGALSDATDDNAGALLASRVFSTSDAAKLGKSVSVPITSGPILTLIKERGVVGAVVTLALVSSNVQRDYSLTLPVGDYGFTMASLPGEYGLSTPELQPADFMPLAVPVYQRPWATNASDFVLDLGFYVSKWNTQGLSTLWSVGNVHLGTNDMSVALDATGLLVVTMGFNTYTSGATGLRPSLSRSHRLVLSRTSNTLRLYLNDAFVLSAKDATPISSDNDCMIGTNVLDPALRLYGFVEALSFRSLAQHPVVKPSRAPVYRRTYAPTIRPSPFGGSMIYSYSYSGPNPVNAVKDAQAKAPDMDDMFN